MHPKQPLKDAVAVKGKITSGSWSLDFWAIKVMKAEDFCSKSNCKACGDLAYYACEYFAYYYKISL